ncbi:pyridoxine 5'-phosphate synthase [Gluconobacter sphaericus]|uniref:Pyridoxine 5'-phosphate synthase n=1 Tax=Gluconobacter sphaericus NBRC 12467 TaxID=1307951 RepID=A0AA37SJ93_9PROT|nr:pyridoxine 5'-phosphate synthase [Gluconobacter sphaericus]MBF0885490.1 pyridoxine 5'-phosphate synthase [Gluconobacter sphaericus]MBS1086035.1 pyridoxine 5'-phosphate synthase [Gluconobacter sphaericus]MBS1096353.1 pyridoxine 5'-phosphate synthase [Gluconobacter sphaericus]MBS1099972.1 pyridoxine 5'-phosphate synthase [Gluconobacter sphaericus]QQX90962.1 pyridoxine 5'-phosphate synthase [Gluconobacter sphaericus]
MIRLGVNIDHVATLRNARGGTFPDPIAAAELAIASGADGITAHLREDRRHIRDADMPRLKALSAPLNFEMAATDEMVRIACDLRPHACCLVPEKRQEITTEGGLDVVGQSEALKPKIARLRDTGIRVSLFIDPEARQIETAAALGAPVVELHTGAYALGGSQELERLRSAAETVAACGLELHAGHGLTYDNVGAIAGLAGLAELNIGHFLIGQAVFDGLGPVVRKMKSLINS